MRAPRGLSEEEAAAWAALAATVDPLNPRQPRLGEGDPVKHGGGAGSVARKPGEASKPLPPKATVPRKALPQAGKVPPSPYVRPLSPPLGGREDRGLDARWDRKLKAGEIAPELTLDLHGHGLDRAYTRLMDGMAQARSIGARSVLIVTGKPRGGDPADRGERRGAIRAKILDWLAASEHGGAIAAVRKAHQRHGGEGALYVVLKRSR